MAKLALFLFAAFFIFQFADCAEIRAKRDVETTTTNILDTIKSNVEQTFSEQNIKKAVDNLNEFGDKLKDLGSTIYTNFQNALKKDETPTTAP
ncbi:hypothetical protein PVAND_011844 [Polypedilum vanderplanki]|uniref:Uncharacterized protein n=1 Tax=Polypedilum vanderplanki TaxID=319348 RepID=A0A9J6CKL5_POLVA|nr:hypothetical protein PVAND_011844 [Polypedilum vanderplanki]